MTRDNLGPFVRLVRVENLCPPVGTPDVYFNYHGNGGWLELKYEPAWPTRGGKLRLSTLTIEQVRWAAAERTANGSAWILAKVGDVVIVPAPPIWGELITGVDPDAIRETALVRSAPNQFPTRELLALFARART